MDHFRKGSCFGFLICEVALEGPVPVLNKNLIIFKSDKEFQKLIFKGNRKRMQPPFPHE